ncbi:MAG: formate dehydrogenase subunit gamma [Gammaproteobacteria bacterium]
MANSKLEHDKTTRRRRAMTWSMAFILVASMALPLGGYYFYGEDANAQTAQESNPRANYWRAVREGNQGYSSVTGQEANVLINSGGQNWRQFRNGPISTYGGILLPVVVGLIALFYLIRGSVKLEGGRSGVMVPRWSAAERTLHWYTAILFIVLAITGLSLLFGRSVLIPVLGAKGFAAWAGFSLTLHNYLGPFFVVGVALIIIVWIRHNLPARGDWQWFRQGGGIVGNKHPSAGKANAGEKVWFWVICTFGVAVCVSGLIMDFPNFGQNREAMQTANLVHTVCGLIWMAVFLGHVYIGTIGSEGSLDAMARGEVDANWARQHHDLWYADVQGGGAQATRKASGGGGGLGMPTDSVLRRHHESLQHGS